MVDPARPAAEHLGSRLEFETLISDLSSRFINLPPDEVDREIEDAMRRVCESLGVDLAVLWQWLGAASAGIKPTHIYATEGLQRPQEMRQDHFPWYLQQMLGGRVVTVSSLEDLPAEAAVDRETCRLLGVKSNLCLPLSVGGDPPVGALGFSTVRAERDWPDLLVTRLRMVAQVFTHALARRRYDMRLRVSEARLASGAELAGIAHYEVDLDAGATWVDDRFRELCGLPPDREAGLQTLEFWMEHLHPDDRARVMDRRDELHDGRLN